MYIHKCRYNSNPNPNLDFILISYLFFLGTESPCHYDPFHNIICQVYGRKEIILFHPDQNVGIYVNICMYAFICHILLS